MKWTQVCPLLSAGLLACATELTEISPPRPPLGTESPSRGGAASPTGFGKAGHAGAGEAGDSPPPAGSFGGGAPIGGSSIFGGGSGSLGHGGVGGTGGASGSATAGRGGSGTAGAGGSSTAGSGGSDSSPQCVGITVPPKAGWTATALEAAAADPPANAFDGDPTTRFSTGDPQDGDEWLQIDFGQIVTLNELTLHTSNNDYFRHYEVRLANSDVHLATALAEGDGRTGIILIQLPEARAGRFLLISQTGTVSPTWWSLHELSIACK